MCGIAGIVRFDGRPIDEASLRQISERIAHRGPDDAGIFVAGSLGLAHRRLSILDLSDAAHQPMRDTASGAVLCYNGEVYNYQELRRRLVDEGCQFQSTGDTEVVLQACRAWGVPAAARLLDGMFAFAYWDAGARELWLVRDRTGIKPLYYYRTDARLLFASEIKALLGEVTPELDETSLLGLLLGIPGSDPHTLFHGIESLAAGHALKIDTHGSIRCQEYYSLAEGVDVVRYRELERTPDAHVVSSVEKLLHRSVTLHLASDATVGVLCSGGLDSSLIALLSRTHLPELQAYHANVAGRFSELAWAEQVANHSGLPLHVAHLTPENYLRDLPRVTYANECPVAFHPNTVPFYQVCRLSAEQGVKVLMTGEGADELFGGYATFRANHRRRRWRAWLERWTTRLPGVGRRAQRLAQRMADAMGSADARSWPAALATRGQSLAIIERARNAYAFLTDPVEREFQVDLFSYLHGYLQTILWRNDRMGMAVGLENRVPYLENELIEYVLNLPRRFKLRGKTDKWALRRAADGRLPRSVARRPKMGFPVDLCTFPDASQQLFRGGFLEQSLGWGQSQLEQVASVSPESRFRLLSAEIWGRLFFMHDHPEALADEIASSAGAVDQAADRRQQAPARALRTRPPEQPATLGATEANS
ncbi:MAG TPA: asparagine synthase (glutamine-hydrolyzing) [Pirellulales bacterium]|nr:asparagine synthase (glutamine-hydrolyzing) [Pirellulales bacterium]